MSKYTTNFYEIDKEINKDEFMTTSVDDRLDKVREIIFDFNYPINEENKKRVEIAILKHYYMNEIGMETIGLFKIYLSDRLNLIMPRYNKLYEYNNAEISPFINSSLEETGTNNQTSSSDITVQSINTLDSKDEFLYEITILVENSEKLTKFINDLETLPNITFVERIIK